MARTRYPQQDNRRSPDPGVVNAEPMPARPKRSCWLGLTLGPILAVVVYLLIPPLQLDQSGSVIGGLSYAGRAIAAVGTLMAVLWVTGALPIAGTALIPIALFPLVPGSEVSIKAATAPYGDRLIFLFMGGFMLALAMQQWGLHRRIALHTILLIGTRPIALIAGFMVASALLSMWVSNTATVVMMLPIALSIIELVRRELRATGDPAYPAEGQPFNFAICLMLGTAYAASIGGVGTLIGTPPNLLLAAFLEEQYAIQISFVRWMGVGLPWWLCSYRLPGGCSSRSSSPFA